MIKKKKKYTSKQKLVYVISTLVIMSFFFYLDFYFKEKKKEKINNGSFETFAVIEKVKSNVRKSGRYNSRKDVVYFYFIRNDTVFHRIENKQNHFIKKNDISLGNSFRIKIASTDYDVFEIDFNDKMKESIDIKSFINVYESERHEKILAK